MRSFKRMIKVRGQDYALLSFIACVFFVVAVNYTNKLEKLKARAVEDETKVNLLAPPVNTNREGLSPPPEPHDDVAGAEVASEEDEKKRKNNDKEPTTIRPWQQDNFCSKFLIQFGKDLPLIYLVSYPKSGSSWLRHLLEGASGYFTGSVYGGEILYNSGFLGENEDHNGGRVVVVNTNGDSGPEPKVHISWNVPVVLLIRNPVKSILSHWSFKVKEETDLFDDIFALNVFNNNEFHSFALRALSNWMKLYNDILRLQTNVLVVFYENLVENPLGEVGRVLEFLQLPPMTEERAKCLEKHKDEKTKINPSQDVDPLTEKERRLFSSVSELVLNAAKSRGTVVDIPFKLYYNLT